MATISTLNINLRASNAALGGDLRRAKGQFQQFEGAIGTSLSRIGGAIAAAFAAQRVFSFFRESLDFFQKQEQSVRSLQQVMNSTGNIARLNIEQLKAFAGERQALTGFGDEVTLQASSVLGTFTQIRGGVFREALVAIEDMNTLLGGDLQSTVIQVGKALNDPIKGITALQRVGVSFTQQQREQIRTLVETGRLQEAQLVILKELNTEFGGQAEAVNETTKAIQQLTNSWGDFKEEVGATIAPTVTEWSNDLRGMLRSLRGLTANELAGAQEDSLAAADRLNASNSPLGELLARQQEIERQIKENEAERTEQAKVRDLFGNEHKNRGLFTLQLGENPQLAELDKVRAELLREQERLRIEILGARAAEETFGPQARGRQPTPRSVFFALGGRDPVASDLARKFAEAAATEMASATKDAISRTLFSAEPIPQPQELAASDRGATVESVSLPSSTATAALERGTAEAFSFAQSFRRGELTDTDKKIERHTADAVEELNQINANLTDPRNKIQVNRISIA